MGIISTQGQITLLVMQLSSYPPARHINVADTSYGVVADVRVPDCVLTSGSPTVTSASNGFSGMPNGAVIRFAQGTTNTVPFYAKKSSGSAGSITLDRNALRTFTCVGLWNVDEATSAGNLQTMLDNKAGLGPIIFEFDGPGYPTNGITLHANQLLWGRSVLGPVFHLLDSKNVPVLDFDQSTTANGQMAGAIFCTFDGAKQLQSTSTIVTIRAISNPAFSKNAGDENFDPHTILQNVVAINGKNGVQGGGRSEGRWVNVWSVVHDGWGFDPGPDSWLTLCTADKNGTYGYLLENPSVRLSLCKAFYSGSVTPASGWGFYVKGASSGTPLIHGAVSLSGCEGQDNTRAAFNIQHAYNVILSACTADSNSSNDPGGSNAGVDPAIIFDDAHKCIVDLACIDRNNASTVAQQAWAARFINGSEGNIVRLTHVFEHGYSGKGPPIDPASTALAGNDVKVNAGEAIQTPSLVSNALTPNMYDGTTILVPQFTSGQTITINAPAALSPGHMGMKVRFITRRASDNTGTLSWNSVYKVGGNGGAGTVANGYKTFDFTNIDGTNWILANDETNIT